MEAHDWKVVHTWKSFHGSIPVRPRLKEIDGRVPPGVELAA